MAVTVTIIGKNKLSGPFGKGARSIAGMGKAIGGLGLKFAKFGAIAGVAIAGIGIKLAADLGDGLREVGTLMGGADRQPDEEYDQGTRILGGFLWESD